MDWTPHIARRLRPPRPPHPTLPIGVAVGALVMTTVSLLVSRVVLDALTRFELPIPVYVVIAGLIGYGPVLVWAWWALRRRGSSLPPSAGLHLRAADVGWGPLTWLCCLATQITVGIVVVVTRIPIESNTEGVADGAVDRGYVISLLVLAVIAAPIVEEIVFRGLVLRGLLSRMGAVPAIAIQAVLFGVAHVDPVRGVGNIGLALVLGSVGATLGAAAYLFRRIGPSILAHGILNAVALTLVLSGVSGEL